MRWRVKGQNIAATTKDNNANERRGTSGRDSVDHGTRARKF
jgi:hypothetical protein